MSLCVLAAVVASLSTSFASQTEAKGTHPKLPDGFSADLVARAPQILWPSAIHCLADGTLLVAEDRMDMPGPSDQPIDKLFALVWKPDGTFEKKLFAADLFAVMGIQEVDGQVFVMNMPHLTRFVDRDGDHVADERVDILSDIGPPAPGWPGGFNDHIVTGLRLGMDGYIYVSVGDKGIPLAHGADGSSITLRGGGIVRVKPDGTKLEIVSSGTRNHLDVAIDERGEMFTYDNTDDGLGWWTRVTHHIPGGYYGYPWDYHEHTDRMLPDIADFGGGSPCGATFYRESIWPKPYAGSAYWCEWGKGILRRFEFERHGASFAIAKDEDFMTAGDVENFRPLDVSESPDGRSLYVADWGYTGWTNPAEAGRVWRVRRSDDAFGVQRPLAALPDDAHPSELAKVLAEPSFQRRLAAQRALSRLHASSDLIQTLVASESEVARRHAIWGLAAIDDRDAHEALRSALHSPSADTRMQAARALGEVGTPRDAIPLAFELDDVDPFVVRWSAWALGRMQSEVGAARLVELLSKSDDLFLQWTCMRSLQRIRDWREVLHGIANADTEVRKKLWSVFRGLYDSDAVEAVLGARLEGTAAAERVALVATLWKEPEPWNGKWWSTQPAAKVEPPKKIVDWAETKMVRDFVVKTLDSSDAALWNAALAAARDLPDAALDLALHKHLRNVALEVHDGAEARELAILDVLAAHKDASSGNLLAELVHDESLPVAVRERLIDTLAAIATPQMTTTLLEVAADDRRTPDVIARAVRALGSAKAAAARATIEHRLSHSSDSVRVEAVAALAKIAGASAAPRLIVALSDRATNVELAAAKELGELKAKEAIVALVHATENPAVRDEAVKALAEMPDAGALVGYLRGLDSKEPAVRDAAKRAIASIRDAVRGELEARATRGELAGESLAIVQKIYSTPQPIRAWKLVGPFAKADGDPKLETVELDPTKPIARGDHVLAWSDAEGDLANGFVDLEVLVSKLANQWAYAATTIHAARAREAEMSVGSDDQITVWLNGEQVFDFEGDRGWSADQDHFNVKLREGDNRLLVRIGQGGGQWSFNAKIAEDGSGPLFEHASAKPSIDEYRALAMLGKGDRARGEKVFRDANRTLCTRCHTVQGVGGRVGPDLSDVGLKYARDEIASSILEPSKRVADAFRATTIVLKSERALFGQIQSEKDGVLTLADQNGDVQSIDVADIEERRESKISLMPDGLVQTMSVAEFADLVAYLESLRSPPSSGGK